MLTFNSPVAGVIQFKIGSWVLMLSRNNILIIALLGAQLCYLIIVSPKKAFWCDEVLTYEVVSQSSFSRMWQATNDTLNQSPPLYFVSLWLWKHIAGTDPMAFRLFSTLCMMGAAFIWWLLLAKVYSKESASLGVIYCFALSTGMHWHLVEARQYALLSLFMSIACFSVYSIYCSKKLNVLNVVVFAFSSMALIYTHYYGVIYSAGITATGILLLMKNKDWKTALILLFASLLAWASFIPWLATLKVHHEVASQCPWFVKPGLWSLFEVLTSQVAALEIFLPLILLCLATSRFSSLNSAATAIDAPSNQLQLNQPGVLLIACMMAGIEFFFFFYSLYVKPMFNPRYLICSYPLWAILVAHTSYRYLLYNASVRSGTPLLTRLLLNITCIAMIGYLVMSAINVPLDNEHQVTFEIFDKTSLPVIDEISLFQIPRWYRSNTPERFVFLLNSADYGCYIGPPRFLADVVKNADRMRAMTIEKFLETTDEFYLIDRSGVDWTNQLILNNHHYHCIELPKVLDFLSIYHVKKVK